VVDFINVKRAKFTYKSLFSSYVLALNELSYEKRTHKTLMKLTPRVDFTKLCLPTKKSPACNVRQKISRSVSPTFFHFEIVMNFAKYLLSFAKIVRHLSNTVHQACQTQTTSRASSALKTDKGATKVLKSSLCGPYFTKSND
jgi:hypothetical protein